MPLAYVQVPLRSPDGIDGQHADRRDGAASAEVTRHAIGDAPELDRDDLRLCVGTFGEDGAHGGSCPERGAFTFPGPRGCQGWVSAVAISLGISRFISLKYLNWLVPGAGLEPAALSHRIHFVHGGPMVLAVMAVTAVVSSNAPLGLRKVKITGELLRTARNQCGSDWSALPASVPVHWTRVQRLSRSRGPILDRGWL
jgi:hypothetical protein